MGEKIKLVEAAADRHGAGADPVDRGRRAGGRDGGQRRAVRDPIRIHPDDHADDGREEHAG